MVGLKKIIFILLGIFALVSLTQSLIQFSKNMAFFEAYKKEYDAESKRNLELKTTIKDLQNISEFEKIARDKLNLHKENEFVLIIPDPTPTPAPTIKIEPPKYKLWLDALTKGPTL